VKIGRRRPTSGAKHLKSPSLPSSAVKGNLGQRESKKGKLFLDGYLDAWPEWMNGHSFSVGVALAKAIENK